MPKPIVGMVIYGWLCLNPGEHRAVWHIQQDGKEVATTIIPAGSGAKTCFPKGYPLRITGAMSTVNEGETVYCRMYERYDDCPRDRYEPKKLLP